MDSKEQKFLDLLNSQYSWPAIYPFKFVVKTTEVQLLCALFPGLTPAAKLSGSGNYTSLTFEIEVPSGEAVLAYYRRVQSVPGVISL